MDAIEQTSSDALAFDISGCRLKEFQFLRRLGQRTIKPGFYGVNSAVYLVSLKTNPEFYYALKICLNVDPTNVQSAELLERFRCEHELQIRDDRMPRHRNIVRVLSVFTDNVAPGALPDWDFDAVAPHSVVAVMEFIPLTLAQVITVAHAKPAPPYFTDEEALSIAAAILAGVAHMNTHRVAHRDLKPDNVLLSPDRSVIRIGDFGCCLDCRHEHLKGLRMPFNLSNTTRGGAPAYLAPEVMMAAHGPDVVIDYAKNDVFAAGLILYCMLSADDWPFPAREHRAYTAATYRPLPAVYCEALRLIIDGMLALDPDTRYSATEAYALTCAALAELQAQARDGGTEPTRPRGNGA